MTHIRAHDAFTESPLISAPGSNSWQPGKPLPAAITEDPVNFLNELMREMHRNSSILSNNMPRADFSSQANNRPTVDHAEAVAPV